MLPGPLVPTELTEGVRLAETRERFLTAEPVEPNQVRNTILASWWRSRRWNIAADHIDPAYIRDPDLDTPLIRSALPVLRNLREHLEGQPISIILTDAAGVVLTRLVADRHLDRHLDSVQLAPGFSYAEESVGTNGIGTALEGGRPMHVFGHEHYAEHLEDLACAGVPIHHPISGKTVGAVDLTCWRKDAGPLLITLARTTADQIRQALLTDSGMREFALLQEYLRTCRRSAGMVLALNNDVVMMNDYARDVLDPVDQSVLLGLAAEALASGHSGPVAVDLPTGATARMYCRPVRGDGELAGGVVNVKLTGPGDRPVAAVAVSARAPQAGLPGLVGSGPLWLRAGHQVEAGYDAGEWLAMAGEPGAGKLALIRAVHQRRNPAGAFHVLDASDADHDWPGRVARELLERDGTLVIRHVDKLAAARSRALSSALRAYRATARHRARWVAVTMGVGGAVPPTPASAPASGDLAELLQLFPSTVEVPPLRHHVEDVHELVPFFLTKLSPDGRLLCSPEAMQLLVRSRWPGNIEQLSQVLKRVVQHRRTGTIQPNDLPPECRTVSRRLLSPLESMERDAIVQSLLDAAGNKVKAATSLGMSRATIYRKIHEYGIVSPTR
jgi:sigma-54 dependent transcriptional regulator, acetoin dehydrogenase operon transcriptional activator AcoR